VVKGNGEDEKKEGGKWKKGKWERIGRQKMWKKGRFRKREME